MHPHPLFNTLIRVYWHPLLFQSIETIASGGIATISSRNTGRVRTVRGTVPAVKLFVLTQIKTCDIY